jgi:two-component system phosphate regulon response regulator PhoB
MIQSAFREAGVRCQWRVIENGTDAMRIAESSVEAVKPDLILLDWQLPGATGLEVLATLKQNSKWVSTPVIMLTGMRSAFHVSAARRAGAYDVLEKPMQLDEWLSILRESTEHSPQLSAMLHSRNPSDDFKRA